MHLQYIASGASRSLQSFIAQLEKNLIAWEYYNAADKGIIKAGNIPSVGSDIHNI